MVTFVNKGRLGNFLFECATAQSYAIDNNLKFTIPFPNKSSYWNPIYFNHLYQSNNGVLSQTIVIEEDKYFEYKEIPFKEEWRDKTIVLDGYFQSENYFKHNINQILESWKIAIKLNPGFVGVHVRRGDYTVYKDKHIVITKQWIEKAKEHFKGYEFLFFSDDIAWCRQNFPKDRFIFGKQKPLDDLMLLAGCEHQIISPSTFGWWGAYLNPNKDKKVIITKDWFKPTFKDDGSEIILKNWIRL